MGRIFLCIAWIALFASGCGDESRVPAAATDSDGETDGETDIDSGSDPSVGAAFVRFDLGPAPLALGAVPFPSELYRDAQGRIAIGALPNPASDDAMWMATRELLAARDGFCTTCNAIFVLEGGMATDALPAADAEPSLLEDAVVIVDVDPDSPEHGRVFGVRWQWDEDTGWLTVRPRRGETLAARRRYAIALTDVARGGDDLPLGADPAFVSARDDAPSDDPILAAAAADLRPAFDQLEALGLPRARVRALAAFRTEDPTDDLQAIRAAIAAAPATTAHVDTVWSGAALDDLLGVPGEDRPGVDLPPAAGTDGTVAIPHETTAFAIAGHFGAPRFVQGTGAEIGATVRDADGDPAPGPLEDVPFLLIVPEGVDVAHLPVVVMHHGFNASRTTGFAIADTAGRAGFAVLAIDAFQHGARAASAKDTQHALRGDIAGADGFAETSELDVSARTFGLTGAADGMVLFPGYALGAFEQFAADAMAAIRLVRDGDLTAVRAADPALGALAFDPSRLAFLGNSMGAVVGTAVVTADSDVGAAVLNVLPGSIVETLVESGEFRPLTQGVLLPQVGVSGEYDEIERSLLMDPSVDLFRWVLEPVDPLALARALVTERVAGPAPDLLVQLAGHDEVAAPPASESVIAAATIGGTGTFAFAPVASIDLPQSGSADRPVAAAARFDGAMHGMLEVRMQTSSFEEPLVPPLVARAVPTSVSNPIVAVHDQIEMFLRTFGETGHATIGAE
jgi:hypothetical protein